MNTPDFVDADADANPTHQKVELTVNNSLLQLEGNLAIVLSTSAGLVVAHNSTNSGHGLDGTTLTYYSEAGVEIIAHCSDIGCVAMYMDTTGDIYMARAFDWLGNPLSNEMSFAAYSGGSLSNGSIFGQISATMLDDGYIAVPYQTVGSDIDTSGVALTILDGGAGRDFLGGGPATDEFRFSNYEDSVANGLRDRILDFQQGVDIINVDLIEALLHKWCEGFTVCIQWGSNDA